MEKIINYAEHIKSCEECPYYENDLKFCEKAAAYNYTGAELADFCPLPIAKPKRTKLKIGGRFFKYYCPICKSEYMSYKIGECVKCGVLFDGYEKETDNE